MSHTDHKLDRDTLKSFFMPGERPTSHDFKDLIDSTVNIKEDGISVDHCDLTIDRNVIINGEDKKHDTCLTVKNDALFEGKTTIHGHDHETSLEVSGKTIIEGELVVQSDKDHPDVTVNHGTVTATKFIGDGSQLTGINDGNWKEYKGGIYFDTGDVGIGTHHPHEKLDVDGNTILRGDLSVEGNLEVKGAITGSDLVEPKLSTGIQDFGKPYAPVSYYKDVTGRVCLAGMLTANKEVDKLFTLNEDYRPEFTCVFPAALRKRFTSIEVSADGVVRVQEKLEEGDYVSLEGITFISKVDSKSPKLYGLDDTPTMPE